MDKDQLRRMQDSPEGHRAYSKMLRDAGGMKGLVHSLMDSSQEDNDRAEQEAADHLGVTVEEYRRARHERVKDDFREILGIEYPD